jgi:hypothetical protein
MHCEPAVRGRDAEGASLAVGKLSDRCGPGNADFIEAVVAVDDKRALDAEALEDRGDDVEQVAAGDAEQAAARVRGVRHRAEEVEDGADADLSAGGADVLHRGVEGLREHEADACGVDAAGDLLRCEVDLRAERFEDVGTAAL